MKYLTLLILFVFVGCGSASEEIDLDPSLEPGGSNNQSSIVEKDAPETPIAQEPSEEENMIDPPSETRNRKFRRSDVPQSLLADIERRLQPSRYMARNCVSASYKGYEGLPVERCQYTMRDGSKGTVYMLNPNPLQLAVWIKDSCQYIGKNVESCGKKLFRSVLFASGGQFPIAGMVYEDLNGNGKSESYAFRHGITVKISSIGTGSERKLSRSQMNDALYAPVVRTYRFARIVSTTREQYYSYMNREGIEPIDVGGSSTNKRKNSWMDVSKYLYTIAWGNKTNVMMRAWANSNRSKL